MALSLVVQLYLLQEAKAFLLNDEIIDYMQDKFSSIMQFTTINNAAHHVLIDEPDILLDLINKKLSDWT